VGTRLRALREDHGWSVEQLAAATRIRGSQIEALESGRVDRLPGPVYVRGYVRSCAAALGADVDELLDELDRSIGVHEVVGVKPIRSVEVRRGPALSAPLVTGAVMALLVGTFAAYASHELGVLRQPASGATPAAAPTVLPTIVGSPPPPPPTPVPTPRQVNVALTFTSDVWIDVQVDGKPQMGGNGRFFRAGDKVSFTGTTIKVSSGKAANTMVSVDGAPAAPLGDGVLSKEFGGHT
jgi:cytoskeletal protein RodZ